LPETVDLMLHGAGQLLTCRGPGKGPKRSSSLSDPGLVENGAIAVADGKIFAVGTEEDVRKKIGSARVAESIDTGGRAILPGWVDPHTHAVFSHYRADEYEARIRGESYLEIGKRGGGIKRTVREVRKMDEERLFDVSRRRLLGMLKQGVTTVEIKSGYGLDMVSELKMLRVIARLGRETPLDVVATFMGAHEKPPEYGDGAEYLRVVIEEMLPVVAKEKLAEFIDVFCESGVFDLEETARVFEAGTKYGLGLKVHAEEITPMGSAELAADAGAVSADHLVKVSDEGIRKLAASSTIAVLLPSTTFLLGSSEFAPARKLIDAGAAVAIASDFNPGSAPSGSMPLAIAIACSQMRMTPAEAINAATLNAAWSIGRADRIGSLAPGKQADLLILGVSDYRCVPYRFGTNHVRTVLKKGQVVFDRAA